MFFLTTLALLSIIGCKPQPEATASPSQPRTVRMQIGKQTFTLEVADTDALREKGLMRRPTMPDDHGMIFVFPTEQPLSFWMKDTSIPLDILFLDATGQIVSIHQMTPFDLSSTRSASPAKYAIELNQGAAAEAALKPGDRLTIPPAIKEPTEN